MARPGGRAGGGGSARAPGAGHPKPKEHRRCRADRTASPDRRRARRAPPSRPRAHRAGRPRAADQRRLAALDPRARHQRPLALQPAQPVADRLRVPRPRHHPDLRRRLSRLPAPQPLRAQGPDARSRSSPRSPSSSATTRARRPARSAIFFRTVPVFDVSMTDPLPGVEPVPLTPARAADRRRQPPAPDRPAARARAASSATASRPASCPTTVPAAGATPSAGRSSSPPGPPTGRSARLCTSSPTHSASATAVRARAGRGARRLRHLRRLLLRRARRRRRVDPLHRRLGRRRRAGRDPRLRRRRSTTIARRIEDALERRSEHDADRVAAGRLSSAARRRSVGAARAPSVGRAGRRTVRRTRRWAGRRPASPAGRGASSPRPNGARRDHHPAPAPPRGDEDALYRRHHRNLQRAVARAVNAPRELIEDACQTAWTILLRTQPDRARDLRLAARRRHPRGLPPQPHRTATPHLEDLDHSEGWDAVIADRVTIDDTIEARRALERLAELPDRQRRDLVLRVAGFTYREIAQITGGRTYTNVNKHLRKARARIRLEELRDAGAKNAPPILFMSDMRVLARPNPSGPT